MYVWVHNSLLRHGDKIIALPNDEIDKGMLDAERLEYFVKIGKIEKRRKAKKKDKSDETA
jgi:hypothetical protein